MLHLQPLTKKLYKEYLSSNLFNEMLKFSNDFSKTKKSFVYNRVWIKNSFLHFSRKAEYQFVFEQVEENKKILDAGCGITFFPLFLESKFKNINIDLVDFSNSTEKYYKNTKFNFIKSNLEDLEILDAEYDLIYCISTLEHIENYNKVVEELYRILKPNGKLVLTFDISFSKNDNINIYNTQEFFDAIISTFQISQTNYVINIDDLITSHDFQKHELPWVYPKIFYKIYYFLFRKKIISTWPPKIGVAMMTILK